MFDLDIIKKLNSKACQQEPEIKIRFLCKCCNNWYEPKLIAAVDSDGEYICRGCI